MSDEVPEKSLAEQLKEQELENTLIEKIFKETRLKLHPNDPIIQLLIAWHFLNEDARAELKLLSNKQLDYINTALAGYAHDTIANITAQQQRISDEFDARLDELKDILNYLENQKEVIVADVWGKMQDRVTKQIEQQLSSDLQAMAKNANNQINNQRNLLTGALIGTVVGVIICLLVIFVVK